MYFTLFLMNFSESPYEVNDLVLPCGWLENFDLVRRLIAKNSNLLQLQKPMP